MSIKKEDVITPVGDMVYVKYNKESKSEWKVEIYLKCNISRAAIQLDPWINRQ